jgi:hypothetical protein
MVQSGNLCLVQVTPSRLLCLVGRETMDLGLLRTKVCQLNVYFNKNFLS